MCCIILYGGTNILFKRTEQIEQGLIHEDDQKRHLAYDFILNMFRHDESIIEYKGNSI
jgi:hypothetical protein